MATEKPSDHKNISENTDLLLQKLQKLNKDFAPNAFAANPNTSNPACLAFEIAKDIKAKEEGEKLKNKTRIDVSLDSIQKDPELFKAFKEFLKKEHSRENLDFILAMQAIEKKSALEDRQLSLKTLYKYYIKDDAKFQINLPDEIKIACQPMNPIKHENKQVDPKFDFAAYKKAEENIRRLIEHDTIPRFMTERERLKKEQGKKPAIKPGR